jgi:hypothetical protein
MRIDRQRDNAPTRRCKKCSKDRHRRLSILQEATALQLFLQFSPSTIDAPSASLRLIGAVQNAVAWTLSRKFWQQKNFCVYRVGVSSALAKTEFLDESPLPIRGHVSGRGDEFSDRDERSTRLRASDRDGGNDAAVPLRDVQMPSFDFSRTLTAFGSTLPPDAFMT